MKLTLAALIVLATVSLAAIQSNAPAGKLEIDFALNRRSAGDRWRRPDQK